MALCLQLEPHSYYILPQMPALAHRLLSCKIAEYTTRKPKAKVLDVESTISKGIEQVDKMFLFHAPLQKQIQIFNKGYHNASRQL